MSLRRWAAIATVTLAGLGVAGCGTGHRPALTDPSPANAVPTGPVDPAGQLAGLAAAAHDRRYVAAYTIAGPGGRHRSLLASLAADGTWLVNVSGGALGGGGDVAIVGLKSGTYQCLLGGPATTAATRTAPNPAVSPGPGTLGPSGSTPQPPTPGSPSLPGATRPSATPPGSPTSPALPTPQFAAPACVKVASAGKSVPKRYDPVFEHIFTDWLGVMLDRDAPISVFAASPLPESTGTCYSVDSNSASLAPVMGSGIFCFTPDGTLTAAKITAGTLTLTGPTVAAPGTTTLPAPITPGPAAPTRAP